VRSEILHLETAAAPKLSLKSGTPLVHARGGLMPRIGHDQSAVGADGHTPGTNGFPKEGGVSPTDHVQVRIVVLRRIRVQERIAVRLVGIVIDAAAGPEHGPFTDAIRDSKSRSPILMIGIGEAKTRRSADQRRLVRI